MLWCQAAQNIALSNHKIKSALKCTVNITTGRTARQNNCEFTSASSS